MKNIIITLFMSVITMSCMTSCECPVCPGEEKLVNEYEHSGIHYSSDRLSARTLIGKWSSDSHNMVIVGLGEVIGNQPSEKYEIHEIWFINEEECDLYISKQYQTERRMYTFNWIYNGSGIYLYRNDKNGQEKSLFFGIKDFLYPHLTIKDSWGTYALKKNFTYD